MNCKLCATPIKDTEEFGHDKLDAWHMICLENTLGIEVSDALMVEEAFGGIPGDMTEEEYINAKRPQS